MEGRHRGRLIRFLIVVCEGHAERDFVNTVLVPFASTHYAHISAPLVGKKVSAQGGGDVSWSRLGKELPNYLSQGHATVTTLLDLFRLNGNMPGYLPVGSNPPAVRAQSVERAMTAILAPYVRHSGHFVPYVQVQEYEAVLFSDPPAFERATGYAGSAQKIVEALKGLNGPEEVNGNQPPGVRLEGWFPAYQKRSDGTLAAQAIGVPAMRMACPRFDAWLAQLGL